MKVRVGCSGSKSLINSLKDFEKFLTALGSNHCTAEPKSIVKSEKNMTYYTMLGSIDVVVSLSAVRKWFIPVMNSLQIKKVILFSTQYNVFKKTGNTNLSHVLRITDTSNFYEIYNLHLTKGSFDQRPVYCSTTHKSQRFVFNSIPIKLRF